MSDVMDQAVARTDRAFLDIALRVITDARNTNNPLVHDLNMDIANMVLRELYDRVELRTR